MIKLINDTINRSDIKALSRWLLQDPTPRLTKGKLTKELEQKWADWIGTKYSVFVNSGSSAILLLLAALKETRRIDGANIVVPSLSWSTDVSSCIHLGFKPILCDCNMNDLSIDIDEFEALTRQYNIGALILVYVLGIPPINLSKIIEICKARNILLIEDVCEGMGSFVKGHKLGNVGVASVFSLYFGHHISSIEGGFINTNNDNLYKVLVSMRSHGWDRDWDDRSNEFENLYKFFYPGFNLRSTDLQAFLALRQVDRLDEICFERNQNFHLYKKHLWNNSLNIEERSGSFISNFAYPIVRKNRNEIVEKLKKEDVEVRPLIAGSMAKQPFWIRYNKKSQFFPNCEIIHNYGFYVPNHPDLLESDIEFVSKIVNET